MKKRFEDNINELKDIAQKLENDVLPLDEAVSLYEKGIKIARECEKMLSDAETTVRFLAGKGGDQT